MPTWQRTKHSEATAVACPSHPLQSCSLAESPTPHPAPPGQPGTTLGAPRLRLERERRTPVLLAAP